jgi:hypothetical protein
MPKIIIFLFALLLPLTTLAWDNTGHKIIAHIAYQQLNPNAKTQVDALLKVSGPLFPPASSIETAATWADRIKLKGIKTYSQWHYIALPFSADGTSTPAFVQKENVLWAIKKSDSVLTNPKATLVEKALFLRFLLHFVGDIHQPLHCINYYSKDFPNGDLGGNRFKIYYDHHLINLHVFWDHSLELFRDYSEKDKIAHFSKIITQRYSKANLQTKVNNLNLNAWVTDCHNLAINNIYTLRRGASASAEYIFQNRELAMHQLALAGYRLGAVLNKMYSDSSPPL